MQFYSIPHLLKVQNKKMLIQLGYEFRFNIPTQVAFVAMLRVHSSRANQLQAPDVMKVDPDVKVNEYLDSFGNHCARFVAPPGPLRIYSSSVIEDSGERDPVNYDAREVPVQDLPPEALRFLLNSRYCEMDLLSNTAAELFGHLRPGWSRVQAVCDWVWSKILFGYGYTRTSKTAMDVYTERTGVCRDFQHLAITFCRCLNIPARYATGYLTDIGVAGPLTPMDFSAWFEVYLEDRWWAFDARNNTPRIGRILMATGRDAADVALTTSFGSAYLTDFSVVAEEVPAESLIAAAQS